LQCDMVLQEDLRTESGLLLVPKGQMITLPLLMRIRNFWHKQSSSRRVLVEVPLETTANK